MWTFVTSLLDVLLPRKARVVRSDSYTIADLQISPREHEVCGVRITTLMSYKTPAVDDLIRALKYDRARHAARVLAEALAEYLREEISSLKLFSPCPIVLVPVPLHSTRIHERGFNQVELVLSYLPKEFHDGTLAHVVPDALVRTRPTQQQTKLTRSERLKNVEGAFQISKPHHIKDTHVILIDDVTTTGATLTEAARPFGESIVGLLALAMA